jgi:putative oxidoreductase
MDDSFNLQNGYVLLRIICGAFLVPHAVGKFTARQASVGFFTAAGFKPPAFWVMTALIVEVILGIALVFGIFTEWAAYVSGLYLLVAAAANFKLSRKWLWHIGGSEWPVFWAICCFIVGWYGSPDGVFRVYLGSH